MGDGHPAGCRGVRVPERIGSTPARARCKTSHNLDLEKEKTMKIKIIRCVPTNPSPEIGKVYEVIRINERSRDDGGNVYFVKCEGQEVGVLKHEMSIVEE